MRVFETNSRGTRGGGREEEWGGEGSRDLLLLLLLLLLLCFSGTVSWSRNRMFVTRGSCDERCRCCRYCCGGDG